MLQHGVWDADNSLDRCGGVFGLTSSQGPAQLLSIDGETGTLEAGKFADIVAVPGDVLRDIRATERPVLVMKQGVVMRGEK